MKKNSMLLLMLSVVSLTAVSCDNNDENLEEIQVDPAILSRSVDTSILEEWASCANIPRPADAYTYPFLADSIHYYQLKYSMEVVQKACEIPDETVKKMSTKALLQAYIEYPFWDWWGFSSNLYWYKDEFSPTNFFQELIHRKDAGKCLFEAYLTFNPIACMYAYRISAPMRVLMTLNEMLSQLSLTDKKALAASEFKKYDAYVAKYGDDPHYTTLDYVTGRIMLSARYQPFMNEYNKYKKLRAFLQTELDDPIPLTLEEDKQYDVRKIRELAKGFIK